jgi:branched-chain amino acid transport system permease protein
VTSWFLVRRWPLGLVLVAVAALVPFFAPNDYVLRLFIQYGCIYAVILAGLNVLIGGTGQVSLGHVALVAIGAYAGGAAGAAGMPWMVTALIAVTLAVVGGLLIGAPALRLRGAYLALSTLAFALIVVQLIGALPGLLGNPDAARIADVPRPVFGALVLSNDAAYYWFCLALAAPVVWLSRNVFWTATGRQLLAVKDNESAASALGIGVFSAKLGAFLFSAACAGLAGAMFASFNEAVFAEDFTSIESLRYVVALLIGGLAAPVAGPVAGAVATVALVYVGQVYFEAEQALLTALVFLGILAFAPRGVGGVGRAVLTRLRLGWLLPGGALTALARRNARVASPTAPDASRTAGPGSGPGDARDAGTDTGPAPGADPTRVSAILRRPDPPTNPDEPLLSCRGIVRTYGGVRAVDGVDLDVAGGAIHALMGPNGSGKSTLLNVVSGLLRADDGTVRLDGTDVSALPAFRRARAGIGRTFQEIRLFPSLTALENCMLGEGSTHRVVPQLLRLPATRREDEQHATAALELLDAWGLGDFAERTADALSYGQRKMLELARAAARSPRLLLIDEPSAGLNPRWVDAMVAALRTLREGGITLLLVEHHQDVIADLADTVTVLDQGRVIAEGPPAVVQRDQRVLDVYLGTGVSAGPGAGVHP